MEVRANYASISIDIKNLRKYHCKQLLFGKLPNIYFIYYLGYPVTASAFQYISFRKIENLISEGPPKRISGGGRALIRDVAVAEVVLPLSKYFTRGLS